MDVPPKTSPRLFLIDAYALIYRAYFAFIQRPLLNSRGENTSAPYGFLQFLLRIRDEHQPDYIAVVFDSGMSQREVEYPDYKATREKMPQELEESLPRIRDLVAALNGAIVAVDGWEADDVIGTLALQARDAGVEAVIVSGDKDFHQLVGPGIHLLNPGRGGPSGVAAEWVDERNAEERLGIPPSQVIDYLALVGDTSDNVPGAPGIGPKTAITLLREFGSVERLLERAEEVPGKRARESLRMHADQVRLSKRLVTIRTDVPITLDLDLLGVRDPDLPRLRDLLVSLEFRTLIDRFAAEEGTLLGEGGEAPPVDYRLIGSVAELEPILATARERGEICIDTETTSRDPMQAQLIGLSLSTDEGRGWYLPFRHRVREEMPELLLDPEEPSAAERAVPNLPPLLSAEMAPLRAVLLDPAIRKIGHNLKYDRIVLEEEGVGLEGVAYDTMVASYLIDPARRQHGLDDLATDLLHLSTLRYEDVAGKGRKEIPFAEVELSVARDYACQDVDIPLRLREHFTPRLEELGLVRLFDEIEMPLVGILSEMERKGIRIDRELFARMSRHLEGELAALQEKIHIEAGGAFNINSVPQLREILFERLDLPVIKRTKTGPSTDSDVLEALAGQGHELPRLMIEYRELEKLRSTYIDALPRMVNPRTGRIHTSFNQTVAQTGRLSSSDPNLQNIPIRTPLGREIRKGFIAEEGHLLLAADYSQIELRVMAHLSGDEAFVQAFREGLDIHRQTAAIIFDIPLEEVTSSQRGAAKTVNFGVLYGQGEFSLGNQLGIGREAAKSFIADYFERFPAVRRYLDRQVAVAQEQGWVETLAGRRRSIPELRSKNWNVRQFGERVAQNTPIQGSAADLIKRAMLEVEEGRIAKGLPGALLLQVHDELVFEVPEEAVDAFQEMVVERMESAMQLDVPLRVDVGRGRSWFDTDG